MTIARSARLATVLVAAAVLVLVGSADVAAHPWPTAVLGAIAGLAWTFTGLAAWERRPDNRTGLVMIGVGAVWWLTLLSFTGVSLLYTLGLIAAPCVQAAFVHLLLAFPDGRLHGRLSRIVVAAAYVDTLVVVGVSELFDDPHADGVRNLVLVHRDRALADALNGVAATVGVLLFGTCIVILARRWRRASPPWRHAFAPVLWSGAAAAAVLSVMLIAAAAGAQSEASEAASVVMFALVPFAFQIGFWRSHRGRGAVADLVVELGGAQAPGRLRDALARTLGDPSLAIGYWLPDRERYVDADGRPVDLPAPGGSRVATVIDRRGRRVATLLHDASLLERPELIEATCAAAGLALENERLQADLSARVVELQASRARIVEAGDAARKRIERDLHDGAQQRLVSVSMALGLAESRLADPGARGIVTAARTDLGTALHELRELSQGIHPSVLTERGLGTALQELAYAAPLRVTVDVALDRRPPEAIEVAAYFVAAEALANVTKHAGAAHARISIEPVEGWLVVAVSDDGCGGADATRGSGLRGLADRVDALGGTLTVASPPGAGTRLTAEIPCAS